jgi:type VI secretion system protein ImpE
MNATDLFRANRLPEAIDAQLKEVKANPADQGKRLFLFELLAFSGDLERARRQLDAIQYDQPELATATLEYRQLLDAELLRRRLFNELLVPGFFGSPPEHITLRLDALKRTREGNLPEAAELLTRADALVPPLRGKLNGKDFEGVRDCDDLFSYVLEVMGQGLYYWLPLEQVASLAMKPPRFPRDTLWIPTRLDLHDGASGEVFLPALYPGTHEHSDSAVKLGRSNDWKTGGDGGPVRGVGARQFLVGDDAVTLLDWRELVLEEPARPGESPS